MTTNTTVSTTSYAKGREGMITAVSAQWARRPADQRFLSLDEAREAAHQHRLAARTASILPRDLRVESAGDEVLIKGERGSALLTNHAFGQVAALAGAPASYLRKLPADLAASCLREGLTTRGEAREDADRLLLRAEGSTLRAHAITSSRYARIWNVEVLDALRALRERQPAWDVPVAGRSAQRVTGTGEGFASWAEHGDEASRRLPTCFVSDRDAFVFLTDQQNVVERPDGDGGVTRLFRGFYIQNSEVGAASLRVVFFLYDAVCCNVLIWGVRDVASINLRHVGNVRDAVLGAGSRVPAAIASFAQRPASADAAVITRAQNLLVADTRDATVDALLKRRIPGLTESLVRSALTVAEETPRYGNPHSVWAVVNGLTEVSQRTAWADERVALDAAAGRVLEIAF